LCTLYRNEEGIYYAIDLGGTIFRALRVEVGAGSVVTSRKVELPIPEELTKGTIEVLVISYNFQFLI
jgi:hexokinase